MPILLISKVVPPHIERACSLQVAETGDPSQYKALEGDDGEIDSIRRGFRKTHDFEVRYWTLPELERVYWNGSPSRNRFGRRFLVPDPRDRPVHFLHGKYRLSFMLPKGCGD